MNIKQQISEDVTFEVRPLAGATDASLEEVTVRNRTGEERLLIEAKRYTRPVRDGVHTWTQVDAHPSRDAEVEVRHFPGSPTFAVVEFGKLSIYISVQQLAELAQAARQADLDRHLVEVGE